MTDAAAVSLRALGWIVSDEQRAQRFLDLTGLTPEGLRKVLDQPSTHRAVIAFLCAHEPDLVAAAAALEMSPARLAALQDRL
ncbi:MAG: DUF3572 family protein [Croceibacterium sp.]